MGNRAIKLINKDQEFILDSNRGAQEYICVSNPKLAAQVSKTQSWFITDERLITNLDGSKALTFQAPDKVSLEPIKGDDSQKWTLDDKGLIKCDLNNYVLITMEDGIEQYISGLPANSEFSDNILCKPLADANNIQKCEKWELRYIDNDELCNDKLARKITPPPPPPPPKPSNQIQKINAVGPLNVPESYLQLFNPRPFDFRPPSNMKRPRVHFIQFEQNAFHFLRALKVFWVDLDNYDTITGRYRMAGGYETVYPYLDLPPSPNVYITKIQGSWADWERVYPNSTPSNPQIAETGSFYSLSFTSNLGFIKDLGYSKSRYDAVPLGTIHDVLGNPPIHLRFKQKNNVSLEAPPGYEIIGFHGTFGGTYISNPGKSNYGDFLLSLGLYVKPAS